MEEHFSQLKDELQEHLDNGSISWLLGAGISIPAGIPAIGVLTEQVKKRLNGKSKEILISLNTDLCDNKDVAPPTIETILNHLVDHLAIAKRGSLAVSKIGDNGFNREELEEAYQEIVKNIACIVKNGTNVKPSEINIDHHRDFVKAIFSIKKGKSYSEPSHLFTLNYDTLIEDALALEEISYWDGFEGGAVAFRIHKYGDEIIEKKQAILVKLHGSIDWTTNEKGAIVRTREEFSYIKSEQKPVIIYPQANKYISTQKDPFSSQFELFRKKLFNTKTLVVCGYSFGDDHINEIIESSMDKTELTLLVFSDKEVIKEWKKKPWLSRVFWLNKVGISKGSNDYSYPFEGKSELNWWTFEELIKILENGITNYNPRPNEQF